MPSGHTLESIASVGWVQGLDVAVAKGEGEGLIFFKTTSLTNWGGIILIGRIASSKRTGSCFFFKNWSLLHKVLEKGIF